jgi:hypothetical protein
MGRRALVDLVLRPVTLIQVAVFAPLAFLMLFLAAPLRPGAAVAASSIACAGFGLFVGQAIRVAARCSLTWTLPGFRRGLVREFVVGGVAVSGLATVITLVGGAGMEQTVPVFAVGFASFSLGAVCLLAPEWTQLLVLAYIILGGQFASRRSASAIIHSAPLVIFAIAGTVSAIVLRGTFSRAALRWSALTGPRQDGQSFWQQWGIRARWSKPGARSIRSGTLAASRARYVGSPVAGGVIANYRAVRPLAWLFLLAVFLLGLAVFVDGVQVDPFAASWAVLVFVWWTSASWSSRSTCQATLPWSRRQHVAIAFIRDLGDALLFLLLMLAAAALVGGVGEMRGPVLRGLAVMAIFFPATRWLSGPPVGERWKNGAAAALLAAVGIATSLVVLNLVVTHLPDMVGSGAAQGALLGLLVILSQVLHWRGLQRFLTTHDLVGDTV